MIADIIQFFLKLFGLRKDEKQAGKDKIAKWETMRLQLLANQTTQLDELDNLKKQIRIIQTTILSKEKERNASSGEIRNIVEREIRQWFSDVDKFKGRQEILFRHLETNSTTIAKIEELVQGLKSPTIQEGVIDLLISELEGLFDKLKDEDVSLRELTQVQYKASVSASVDVDEKLAEFHKENPNLESVTHQETPPTKSREAEIGQNVVEPLTE